jgi:two-component system KDP operon response regulator KdpE
MKVMLPFASPTPSEPRALSFPGAHGDGPPTVLVVAEDGVVLHQAQRALERDGTTVITADSAQGGLRTLFDSRPDLILVDFELESMGVIDLVQRVRELCDTPLIVMRGAGTEADAVRTLRAGADDYVACVSGMPELLARAAALIRRRRAAQSPARKYYFDGVLEIDLLSASASVNGRSLGLTPLELRLLSELVAHRNRTLSTAHLLERVWGADESARGRLKIYVGYLRSKFDAQGVEAPIVTVRGFGYRYDAVYA